MEINPEDDFVNLGSEDFLTEGSADAGHEVTIVDSAVGSFNVAEPVWRQWRDELLAVGGVSPLLHFADTPRTHIDLSAIHPGGLPQFVSGKPILLSNLIREEFALRNARLAAATVEAKASDLRTSRGIDAIYLGIGLAKWNFGGHDYCAPVLMRPMAIRRYGKDFELKLTGQPELNPQLIRVLEAQHHISLDGPTFVALAHSNGTFTPEPMLERLRGLTSPVNGFTVESRLIASSFVDVGMAMEQDTTVLTHPLLDAIAGNVTARTRLLETQKEVVAPDQDVRPPATDNHLLDADSEQEQILAEILAGNSLVVKTLPGTGGTQLAVNAIGALAAQGKRVLVVGSRASSVDSIRHRLDQVKLSGLVVSPNNLRRDLIASILRNEKAVRPNVTDVDEALLRLRKVLLDYRDALGRRDAVLGVSVLDALEELSRLSLLDTPPSTTARLPRRAIEGLASTRAEAAQRLIKCAALGQFKYGPNDSPWYGAAFANSDEATAAHQVAKRLNQQELPKLIERAQDVFGRTAMRPFENIAELGVYIRLAVDIRETLDKFVPSVYDRSLSELIAATAGRRGSDMNGANRRRLKKLAYEYVRPGASIADMHDALTRIQQQRILWQRYVSTGAVPEVPVGVSDLQAAYQRVSEDLARLDAPLGLAGTENSLVETDITTLLNKISGLAADSEVMANLQERMDLLRELSDLNLDVLLDDLSERHVPEEKVADELELAWWQSVLEGMLADDKALLAANTQILDRLEADFRMVDEAHASANGQLLAARLAELWKIGLVDWPDEAERLRLLLRSESVSVGQFFATAPHLARNIAPVWAVSPYEAHLLPADTAFDTVILLDAGATTIAENAGAIRRGVSTVVIGDPVTQTPSSFETAIADVTSEDFVKPDVDRQHIKSALLQCAEILPTHSLTRSYRAGGEDLADVVNRRFYGGKIQFLPWAGTFLGHTSLRMHYVADGTGLPDAHTGAVESVDAEVAKVVELVLEHAAERPTESLMVITASAKHAARVEQSILSAFARRADLAEFLIADRAENFTVLTLEQSVAQSRDRVIFSLGYGRTPHGRLLSEFGALGKPGGERLLAVAMTRGRRSMEIVSCFRPGDLDEDRLNYGMRALTDVLAEAEHGIAATSSVHEPEPMLVDLAARLRARGLHVVLNHGGEIALAASFEGKAVAVDTDAVLARGSLRESLRLRPSMLRRLGWHYLRVHAFELFADPEGVALRIARLIGAATAADDDVATGPLSVVEVEVEVEVEVDAAVVTDDVVTAPLDIPQTGDREE